MKGPERTSPALDSVGLVHRVDTINREVIVAVDGELVTVEVPVTCEVLLHGEPVKLRMVQPRDRVRITHAGPGGPRTARRIEVQPGETAGCGPRDLFPGGVGNRE